MKYEPPTCVCGHLMIVHPVDYCRRACPCYHKTLRTIRRHWLFRWLWVPVTNDLEKARGK